MANHLPDAAGALGKTVFRDMSEGAKAATLEAYKYGEKVAVNGDRVLVRGYSQGLTIDMWVNRATNVIETAYPVVR